MEYKPLPVGIDNFEKLVTRGYYFVDKTLFMKELLDKKGDVNLFTRPRRFGKTLNMSMLQYFFEDARDRDGNKTDNQYLFDSLAIMRTGERYLGHMGQYPVINLTLKSGKQPDFEMAYYAMREEIAREYRRHYFIYESDVLLAGEKKKFLAILELRAKREEYNTSLQFLSQCMEKYYGRKAIVLIDEYDVPLENAFARGFYSEMVDFIRSLFESALKTNSSMEFAVITGCLRISKESIFTGMNNLKIISILNDKYDEYFGFTPQEVQNMCADYGMPQKYDTFQDWYNGYVFGNANVYNPWSVIQFTDDLQENINCFPSSYWANTSSNDIVRKLIERADDSIKAELEDLIDGKTVEKPIHEDITYDEVYKTVDNMWNFMFFTGYFRKVSERTDGDDNLWVTLKIPNREVRYIFRQKIMTWFREKMEARDMTALYTAFVNKDTDTMKEELDQIMLDTISSMDENESYYHGIVAGLLSPMKGYITKSNREGGKGRCDLFVKPVSRRKEAFVVEFKVAKKMKDLEKKANEALQQIEDKQYAAELYDEGYETVSWYGIAFCGKECMVKHMEQ